MIPAILASLRIFGILCLSPYAHFWEPLSTLNKGGAYEGTIQNLLSLALRLWE